jgi:type III restriction enzyme
MLHANFPRDPHVVIDPMLRWHPGDDSLFETGYEKLIAPLVHKIRKGVKAWRDSGYHGASPTTRALMLWWFTREHVLPRADGSMFEFCYYFAQREAVESVVWLYEIERAHDPYSLLRYDSSQALSQGMFSESWTRYVMKLATGAGKTKVMSLLIAWSYFHKRYEPDSQLSQNFLLIAPNIIVLDRLRVDFEGLQIFRQDPVLPPNGWEGQDWENDFQPALHIQDEVRNVSPQGNIFLTNIHRVYKSQPEPTYENSDDLLDYFAGKRPTGKTTDSGIDLGEIVRAVDDLVVLNDEAHHIHDEKLAWFQSIADIHNGLVQRGRKLAVQLDLTATPKHDNGAIFVQTISDYPLVEAIRQGVVKTPVLPDEASRAKLQERQSDDYCEKYQDYLALGYEEWRKACDQLVRLGRKAVMFVMTDVTENCDEVARYLALTYPTLDGHILVIHTKRNGEVTETKTGKESDYLDTLREQSREIDTWESPFQVIVSVMMLREGWDVNNVTTIVGLRPYKSKSQILPEQTLGRGLRRMFRGEDIPEKLSVVGTDGFIRFVEQIKSEGVELEYAAMGPGTAAKTPLVVEVDRDNPKKDIDKLDIEVPILAARVKRNYISLDELNPAALLGTPQPLRKFNSDELREIVFKEIDTDEVSHVTVLDSSLPPNPQGAIDWFIETLRRKLRLVGGLDVLHGKIKKFIEHSLFGQAVDLNDPQVLRNLSELDTRNVLISSFAKGINELTVVDTGHTHIVDRLRYGNSRPRMVKARDSIEAEKTVFNKVVGDGHFELEFASWLDKQAIISFVKNTALRIDYVNADGSISHYIPDFVVHEQSGAIWIIETKGREDLDDRLKIDRLKTWCADASALDQGVRYRALYVRQEDWESGRPKDFAALCGAYRA